MGGETRDQDRAVERQGDDLPARQLVRSVRPPLVELIEDRRPFSGVWLLTALVLLGIGLVIDGLFGTELGIDFDGGDIRRELLAAGQWGQFLSLVIVSVCLLRLQPARWRRLLDLALAAGLVALVVLLLKLCFGRLRPTHELPFVFDGWLLVRGAVPEGIGSYDRASLPSSHTSSAMVLTVFMALLWPRLAWFALVMVLVVAFSRVVFVAHWVGDVCLGGAIGLLIGYPVIRGFWGVRLLDALWVRFIDRSAEPALPHVVAVERRCLERSVDDQSA